MRIFILALTVSLFSQTTLAAISSASFPAVVRNINAESVEVEAQQMKFTVSKAAVTSASIRVGEAVLINLEGDEFIKFTEQLERSLTKSRSPASR